MKKYLLGIICIAIIIISVLVGVYLYRINILDRDAQINYGERVVHEERTQKDETEELLIAIEVGSSEAKITPGSILTTMRVYVECGHTIQSTEPIDDRFINLTKEEFMKEHPGFEVHRFEPGEVVIYQESNNFCGEHFMIRDLDGRLAIFELDRNGNEINLIRVTDIWTGFLTETDLVFIGEGKNIYTRTELVKVLEDFDA
ncbi:MAG: hypothetical protein FWC79_04345 [Oscillospiraceae bacterium]|nr:hypothetical protein [Oscillospiraceae bacterium]